MAADGCFGVTFDITDKLQASRVKSARDRTEMETVRG